MNSHCIWERRTGNSLLGEEEAAESLQKQPGEEEKNGKGHMPLVSAHLQQSLHQSRGCTPQAEKIHRTCHSGNAAGRRLGEGLVLAETHSESAPREVFKLRIKRSSSVKPFSTLDLAMSSLLELEAFPPLIVTIATMNHKHSPTPNLINTNPCLKVLAEGKACPLPCIFSYHLSTEKGEISLWNYQ